MNKWLKLLLVAMAFFVTLSAQAANQTSKQDLIIHEIDQQIQNKFPERAKDIQNLREEICCTALENYFANEIELRELNVACQQSWIIETNSSPSLSYSNMASIAAAYRNCVLTDTITDMK